MSLHAAVRCKANNRERPEQLCRSITGPALDDDRNAGGQVVLKLRTVWLGDTPHLVMSQLEFIQQLAELLRRRTVLPYGLEPDSRMIDCFAAKQPVQ